MPAAPRASAPGVLQVPLSRPPTGQMAGLCLARGTQRHPDRSIGEHELFFVRRGRLAIAEAGTTLDTPAGETLILWPGRRHYGTEIIPAGCEFYWLHVTVPRARPGEPTLAVPQRARPARPERLMELLHRYLHDLGSQCLTPTAASALVMLMFSEIAEQGPTAEADATLAARAEAEITRGFHLALGTAAIARRLGCNPDYLGRVYRQVYGRTIMGAIAERRVTEARRLLLESPGMPIVDIARLCGCRNQAWFRRIFKRVAGTNPDSYRRTHARGHLNS